MSWHEYAAAWADLHGGYDLRRASVLVRGWVRAGYRIARGLTAIRVRPVLLTRLGVLLAALVPVAAGRGTTGLLVASGLVLLAGLAGTLDRAMAVLGLLGGGRRAGKAPRGYGSPRVAIWEAAAHRLAEVGWLAGFWVAGASGVLVVACGALTALHELVRGQALAAGVSQLGAQTVAERPMRVVVTVVGLALAALAGMVDPQLAVGMLTLAAAVWVLLAGLGFWQLAGAVNGSFR